MSAITINGDLVHYEVLGRGKPIILLHSWLGSWRYWIPTMQQLSVKYRTYALDLWGFGDSGRNKPYYHIEGQAELLDKFIERMGIPKAVFVGHGLGAAIMAHYAVRPQSKSVVHRMTVISPPLFGKGFRSQPEPAQPAIEPDAPTLARISPEDRELLKQAAQQAQQAKAQPEEASPAEQPSTEEAATAPVEQPETSTPDSASTDTANPLAAQVGKTAPQAILSKHIDTSSSDFEKLKTEVDKCDEEAFRNSIASLSKHNPMMNIMKATAPTLTLMGADDTFIKVPDETLLSQLSNRNQHKLIIMPSTRHFPMLEDVTRFTRLLREFLEAPNLESLEMKDEWRRRTR